MARLYWTAIIALSRLCGALQSDSVLFSRQQSINLCGGDSSLHSCGAGFPLSFCCPPNTNCLITNGTQDVAAVCCPDGFTCGKVDTITCNISLQNADLFPANPVHTLNLTSTLPLCANGQCCPLGYECGSSGECNALPASVTSAPSSSSTLVTSSAGELTTMITPPPTTFSSATSKSTSTSRVDPTATLSSRPTSSSALIAPPSGSTNGGLIAAGVVPGLVVAAVLAGALFFFLRRRKRSRGIKEISPRAFEKPGSPFGSSAKGAKSKWQISGPITQPQYTNRTEFYHSPSESNVAFSPEGIRPTTSRDLTVTNGLAESDSVTTQPPPPPLPLKINRSAPVGPVGPAVASPISPKSAGFDSESDTRASRGTIRVGLSREPLSPLLPSTRYDPNAAQGIPPMPTGPLSRYNVNTRGGDGKQ